jgi:hypothetical protein
MKTFIVIAFGLALLLALAQSSPLQNIVDEDFQMELQDDSKGIALSGSCNPVFFNLCFAKYVKGRLG